MLLATVGILGALATLAAVFAMMIQLNRFVQRQKTDQVRAALAARSGFERASRGLQRDVLLEPWTDLRSAWVYKPNGPTIAQQRERGAVVPVTLAPGTAPGLPIEAAENPSFKAGVLSSGFAYSGRLRGRYGRDGDFYALKVLDTSSMIDVNGGDLSALRCADASSGGPNGWLVALLNSLGDYLNVTTASHDLGARIVARRTAGGYRSRESLRAVVGDAAYAVIQDFVTVDSWRDSNAILPNPRLTSGNALVTPTSPNNRQSLSLRNVSRAPINVNTAGLPVLAAVYTGLSGVRRASRRVVAGVPTDSYYVTVPLTRDQALNLAGETVYRRAASGPFGGPTAFRNFVSGSSGLRYEYRYNAAGQLTGYTRWVQAGINYDQSAWIWANAMAQTSLVALHPDQAQTPAASLGTQDAADKAALVGFTTEFCYAPTGVFDVASLGRVAMSRFVTASHAVRGTVRAFGLLRHDTQAQFESNRVAGAALDAATQSQPEPIEDGPQVPASSFDGRVALRGELGNPVAPLSVDVRFGFDGGEIAQFAAARAASFDGVRAGGQKIEYDRARTTAQEDRPAVGGGDMRPDGVATGVFRRTPNGDRKVLAYTGFGSRDIDAGTLEFWFKPDWSSYDTNGTLRVLYYHRTPIDARRSLVLEVYAINSYLVSSIRYYDSIDQDGAGLDTSPAAGPFMPLAQGQIALPRLKILNAAGQQIGSYTPALQQGQLLVPQYLAKAKIGYIQYDTAPYPWDLYPGTWHHVAVAWDNVTEHTLFLDGTPYRAVLLTGEVQETVNLPGGGTQLQRRQVLVRPLQYLGQRLRSELQIGMEVDPLTRPNGAFARDQNLPQYDVVAAYADATIDDVVVTHDPARYPIQGTLLRPVPFPNMLGKSFEPRRYPATGQWTGRFPRTAFAAAARVGPLAPIQLGVLRWDERACSSDYSYALGTSTYPDVIVGTRRGTQGAFDDVDKLSPAALSAIPEIVTQTVGATTYTSRPRQIVTGYLDQYRRTLNPQWLYYASQQIRQYSRFNPLDGDGAPLGGTLRPGEDLQYVLRFSGSRRQTPSVESVWVTFATPVSVRDWGEDPGASPRPDPGIEVHPSYARFDDGTYYHYGRGRYQTDTVQANETPINVGGGGGGGVALGGAGGGGVFVPPEKVPSPSGE